MSTVVLHMIWTSMVLKFDQYLQFVNHQLTRQIDKQSEEFLKHLTLINEKDKKFEQGILENKNKYEAEIKGLHEKIKGLEDKYEQS